jgi:NAD(P)-dependent dehydrogenase (short-subunit alcohol dehydrogenase family)
VLTPLHDTADEDFARIIDKNLSGVWRVYKHATPALINGAA